ANNGAPTSVTISNSTSIDTIQFNAGAPTYSFTVQNGATFTITTSIINNPSFEPVFTVNAGAALTVGNGAFVQIGSLAGGGTVTIGPSSSSSLLSIVGNGATTFSGAFAGRGSLELDNAASLTLTGASNGGNIGTIGRDLTLCGTCASPALTISGGALTVGRSTIVDSGTLTVTNRATPPPHQFRRCRQRSDHRSRLERDRHRGDDHRQFRPGVPHHQQRRRAQQPGQRGHRQLPSFPRHSDRDGDRPRLDLERRRSLRSLRWRPHGGARRPPHWQRRRGPV